MHPIRSKNFLSVTFYNTIITYGIFLPIVRSLASDAIVQTKSGPVKGFELKNGLNSMVVFKNVPYAKQPIGDLRFQLPQDVEEWHSENELNYTEKIYCPQANFGQEDCLVLDIYLRKKKASEDENKIKSTDERKAVPVLVYFHAGKFSHGSKEEYSSEFLLEYNDIIVVIPNYRLGVLGFLSLPDSSLAENLGLWDQRMAMKWVYENIDAFGGDQKRITIAGHGSGGTSVGFHILSPLSHSYFSAAISGSGTALDPWSIAHDSERRAAILIKELQCTNTSEICLKTCELSSILKAQAELKNIHVTFLPTVDENAENPFLPYAPKILYEKGYQKDVKYMAGVTQANKLLEVDNGFPIAIKTQHLDSIIKHLINPYLEDLPNFPLIVKAAKYHYLRGVNIDTFESIKPQMVEMMSDILYNSPLHLALKWHSRKTLDTFMYVFNLEDEKNMFDDSYSIPNKKRHFGSGHMGDIFYIFNTILHKRIPLKNNSRTNQVKENLCRIWGNFIESRSEPPDQVWKTFSENEMNYAEISETIKPKINYRKNDIEFWTLLVPDLMNIHNQNETTVVKPLKEIKPGAWGAAGLLILLLVFCIALVGTAIVARRQHNQTTIVPLNSRRGERKYSSKG